MFARINAAALALAMAVTSVAASPVEARTDASCNSGHVECCDSVMSSNSPVASTLAAMLGIPNLPIGGFVGLTCNPISAGGVSGNSCTQQTTCCTGNSFGSGAFVIGCSPFSANV